MFVSHYLAGTGAVLLETREEARALSVLLSELPTLTEVCTVAAPSGALKDARTGKQEKALSGLDGAYSWCADSPGRVVAVYDWHMLSHAPGQWRKLAEALPDLRSPRGAGDGDCASLVVFVAPSWELTPQNPLRGLLPILRLDLPNRQQLETALEAIHPLNGERERVIDSVCGLSADAAQQVAAEVIQRCGGVYDVGALREGRRAMLKDSGLEIWPNVPSLGGLVALQSYVRDEVVPWVRDAQLSVRRILCAGLPGVGKSYCARWIAAQLSCECARLSIPALKAGIVGASEANLKRALTSLDALGRHSPVVCVIDEIDSIASEGLDGGTSSGMFSELLTWLNESTSQVIVIATLNRLDKLDARLESRFQARFFFDLPSPRERAAVAHIHFTTLGCDNPTQAGEWLAQESEGFSSREIATHVVPSVARLTNRIPTPEAIRTVCRATVPTAQSQTAQLNEMRRAASSLQRANDPIGDVSPKTRKIAKGA